MSTFVTSNNQRPQLYHRSRLTIRESANQKPLRRLEMRRLESGEENKIRGEMTAPSQARTTPGPMTSDQQTRATAKKRNDTTAKASKRLFLKSRVIAVTKRVIIPMIVSSQNTSYSPGNLHVGDCQFEGYTLVTCPLHLLSGSIPESARRDQSLDRLW